MGQLWSDLKRMYYICEEELRIIVNSHKTNQMLVIQRPGLPLLEVNY